MICVCTMFLLLTQSVSARKTEQSCRSVDQYTTGYTCAGSVGFESGFKRPLVKADGVCSKDRMERPLNWFEPTQGKEALCLKQRAMGWKLWWGSKIVCTASGICPFWPSSSILCKMHDDAGVPTRSISLWDRKGSADHWCFFAASPKPISSSYSISPPIRFAYIHPVPCNETCIFIICHVPSYSQRFHIRHQVSCWFCATSTLLNC